MRKRSAYGHSYIEVKNKLAALKQTILDNKTNPIAATKTFAEYAF